ncbi:MAG: hypothetical protein WB952_05775 [Terriglobales bacterium]
MGRVKAAYIDFDSVQLVFGGVFHFRYHCVGSSTRVRGICVIIVEVNIPLVGLIRGNGSNAIDEKPEESIVVIAKLNLTFEMENERTRLSCRYWALYGMGKRGRSGHATQGGTAGPDLSPDPDLEIRPSQGAV